MPFRTAVPICWALAVKANIDAKIMRVDFRKLCFVNKRKGVAPLLKNGKPPIGTVIKITTQPGEHNNRKRLAL